MFGDTVEVVSDVFRGPSAGPGTFTEDGLWLSGASGNPQLCEWQWKAGTPRLKIPHKDSTKKKELLFP